MAAPAHFSNVKSSSAMEYNSPFPAEVEVVLSTFPLLKKERMFNIVESVDLPFDGSGIPGVVFAVDSTQKVAILVSKQLKGISDEGVATFKYLNGKAIYPLLDEKKYPGIEADLQKYRNVFSSLQLFANVEYALNLKKLGKSVGLNSKTSISSQYEKIKQQFVVKIQQLQQREEMTVEALKLQSSAHQKKQDEEMADLEQQFSHL